MVDDSSRPDLTGLETGGISLRLYEPGDDVAIQSVFDQVFDVDRGVEDWRWRFLAEPYKRAEIAVMAVGDEVVGHVATVHFPLWVDGQRRWLRQGGDYMLLEAYRGRGIGALLMKAEKMFPDPTDITMSFPVDVVADRLRRRLREREVFTTLPQWVRWRTGSAVASSAGRSLPAVANAATTAGLRVAAAVARRPTGRRRIAVEDRPGDDFDELAERSASFARSIRIRDREYVQWRWIDQPGDRWTLAVAREEGRLTGWVVFGVSPFDGAGAAHVADLLAVDHGTTRALLAFAADALESAGHDVVGFEYLDPRPWSRSACSRAGFLPRGSGPNLVFRPKTADLVEAAGRVESWYLTIGDSDLA